MSGNDDVEEKTRHRAAYTAKNPIPTIQRYREEKDARRAEAQDLDKDGNPPSKEDVVDQFMHADGSDKDHAAEQEEAAESQQIAGASKKEQQGNDENAQPAVDTSEVDPYSTDPRARRKELKKRKDERAERVVTDPVTHLPVTIHDLTSSALKEVPENEEPYGSTDHTATGTQNAKKSNVQLQEESKDLQSKHDDMQGLFPPPSFESVKQDLADIYKTGVSVALGGICLVGLLALALERGSEAILLDNDQRKSISIPVFAIWLIYTAAAGCGIWAIVVAVRDWISKRIDRVWDEEVWDAKSQAKDSNVHDTETVSWLNAVLHSVWPLVNPDLFTSLADTLEDVMQVS